MTRRLFAALAVVTAVLPLTAAATPPTNPWDPKHVLIMGSSTTGCAGPDTPAECYVSLLEASRELDTFTVVAKAGSYVAYGTPAQNWTTTVIPTGNDVVIVQLGVNDWYVPVDPTVYGAQVDELLDRVMAANPNALLLWVRTWMPVPTGTVVNRESMWVRHGYTTADQVLAHGGVFLDMQGTPDPYRSTDPADGGWHYNGGGHQAIAARLLTYL